jgi:hypothetical protein
MLQTLAGLVEVPEEALGSPAVSEPGGRLSYSSSSSPHSKAGTKARAGPGATAAAPSVGLRIPEEEGLHVQRLLAAAAWKVGGLHTTATLVSQVPQIFHKPCMLNAPVLHWLSNAGDSSQALTALEGVLHPPPRLTLGPHRLHRL